MVEAGAFCFGAVIGWFTYYTMRYSTSHGLSDIAIVVGALGGGAVLVLFPAGTTLFGIYGIGLAVGFFVYVFILIFATVAAKGLIGLVDEGEKRNPFMNAR
jgi:hypothetical protein